MLTVADSDGFQRGSMEPFFAEKFQKYSSFISCLASSAILMNEPYAALTQQLLILQPFFNKTSITTPIICFIIHDHTHLINVEPLIFFGSANGWAL